MMSSCLGWTTALMVLLLSARNILHGILYVSVASNSSHELNTGRAQPADWWNNKVNNNGGAHHIRRSSFRIPAGQPSNSSQTSTATFYEKANDRDDLLVQEGDSIWTVREWDAAPIVVESHRLIFFTTAKVACTVWKQLFRRMAGYDDWREATSNMIPWDPAVNGLTYLTDYDRRKASDMLSNPSWTKAIFVRDPKERFLSAYLDKAVRHPTFLANQCCPRKHQQQSLGRNMKSPQQSKGDEERDWWCDVERARSSPAAFLDFVRHQPCDNSHWRPQSRRMEPKYWERIDFVGHMETVAQDAERLLRKIGAWEQYGAAGWPLHHVNGTTTTDGRIFASTGKSGRKHATGAASKLVQYVTPTLERALEEYYVADYTHPLLNLTLNKIYS